MEKKRKSGTAYLMQLAGKYKLHLFVSALFGIASALCSFVPYVMVYRSILVLLDGEGNALRYGLIAAAAIAGKFLCSIVSGTFSHIGAFNTLYNVRTLTWPIEHADQQAHCKSEFGILHRPCFG